MSRYANNGVLSVGLEAVCSEESIMESVRDTWPRVTRRISQVTPPAKCHSNLTKPIHRIYYSYISSDQILLPITFLIINFFISINFTIEKLLFEI